MNLLFFILFCRFAYVLNAKFHYSHIIKTSFPNKTIANEFLSSPYFYESYLQMINAEDVLFIPEIINSTIEFPQIMKYITTPKVTHFPHIFEKMEIQQTWNKIDEKFIGCISCKHLEFTLNLTLDDRDNETLIIMNGQMERKSFYIPNTILKFAMHDFSGILQEITKGKCFV